MQTKIISTDYQQLREYVKKYSYILIDHNIAKFYPDLVGDDVIAYLYESSEQTKNFFHLEKICEFFIENNITRQAKLLIIGGGVTSDIGGLAASLLLRGITWACVPTTLLGMLDAGVGGKTAINSKMGKNLIGSFYAPSQLYLCTDFLKTLPEKELNSGKGELVKYCFLSEKIFQQLEGEVSGDLLKLCIDFKQSITSEDFRETNKRKILNLGHTLGHAIEINSDLTHGECVLFGIYAMIRMYHPDLEQKFLEILSALNLKIPDVKKINFNSVVSALKKDKKKIDSDNIDLIVPISIGNCVVEAHDISNFIEKIKSHEFFDLY